MFFIIYFVLGILFFVTLFILHNLAKKELKRENNYVDNPQSKLSFKDILWWIAILLLWPLFFMLLYSIVLFMTYKISMAKDKNKIAKLIVDYFS